MTKIKCILEMCYVNNELKRFLLYHVTAILLNYSSRVVHIVAFALVTELDTYWIIADSGLEID